MIRMKKNEQKGLLSYSLIQKFRAQEVGELAQIFFLHESPETLTWMCSSTHCRVFLKMGNRLSNSALLKFSVCIYN